MGSTHNKTTATALFKKHSTIYKGHYIQRLSLHSPVCCVLLFFFFYMNTETQLESGIQTQTQVFRLQILFLSSSLSISQRSIFQGEKEQSKSCSPELGLSTVSKWEEEEGKTPYHSQSLHCPLPLVGPDIPLKQRMLNSRGKMSESVHKQLEVFWK